MHHEDWCAAFTYNYCSCDALPFGEEDHDPKYMPNAHNLARIIQRAKEEAWDEGHAAQRSGDYDTAIQDWVVGEANPYRKDA